MSKKHTSAQAISAETQDDALKIAKATQRPGQSKEQTKLIAQGIEKGIAEYKKRQKQNVREQDKLHKKQLKQKNTQLSEQTSENEQDSNNGSQYKKALIISWLAFIAYLAFDLLGS